MKMLKGLLIGMLLFMVTGVNAQNSIGDKSNKDEIKSEEGSGQTVMLINKKEKGFSGYTVSSNQGINQTDPGKDTEYIKKAGKEFKLAANHFEKGLGLTLIGVGGFVYTSKKEPANKNAINVVAGLITLTGVVFQAEAFTHIRKAGILLTQNSVGIAVKL